MSLSSHIFVENGSCIPVLGHGDVSISTSSPNIQHHNVIYAPKIINLIYVCRFTNDNNVYVEISLSRFSMKDLKSDKIISEIPYLSSILSPDSYSLSCSSLFQLLA